MGNCFGHEFKEPGSRAQRAVVPVNTATEPAWAGFGEDGGDRMRPEPAVRVKVVLTKKEGARLLSTLASSDDGSALEKMLSELKRGRRSSRSPHRGNKDCWRPALESIPEN